jgi:LytS/YehU family sensor histidine kinase
MVWQLVGCWLPWAVVTLPILWLGKRFPLQEGSWSRSLPVHFLACALIAVLQSAWFVSLTIWIEPFDTMTKPRAFSEFFWSRLLGESHLQVIVYGMILGVGYAIDYYYKYRERESRASQLEAQLAQAQLQALKMQLHPHFLFNTLNGISGLIRNNKNKAAVNMIAGLSSLLRHALENAGKQEVALREELEFLELYMELQQMRFSDRLHVKVEIAPETLDARVPNLILQPLVENAIRHGVALRAAGGIVGVSASRADNLLEIKVYDDGPGLRHEWRIRGESSGIGLSNTVARLQQLYGNGYNFDIHNRKEGGVEALLMLPFRV